MKAKYLFVDVHSLSYIFELKYLEGVHDFLKMINESDSIKLLDYDKIFFVLNGVNPDETRKKYFSMYTLNDYDGKEAKIKENLISQQFDNPYFEYYVIDIYGYESKDVINSMCNTLENYDISITIASTNKELVQLVSDKVIFKRYQKSLAFNGFETINNKAKMSEVLFGVKAELIPDLLALTGNSNIKLVKGYGLKKAKNLLDNYLSLKHLLSVSIGDNQELKNKLKPYLNQEEIQELIKLSEMFKLIDIPNINNHISLLTKEQDKKRI